LTRYDAVLRKIRARKTTEIENAADREEIVLEVL